MPNDTNNFNRSGKGNFPSIIDLDIEKSEGHFFQLSKNI